METGKKILALETSSDACSVALLNGQHMVAEFVLAPKQHAQLVLPMIEQVLAEAGLMLNDIDVLAYGRGPGMFTGVRIASCVIQGISFASDIPVLAISSLATLAQRVEEHDGAPILVAVDARKEEVYWACYQHISGQGLSLLGEEVVCLPQQVPLLNGLKPDSHGIGSGWDVYQEELKNRVGATVNIHKEYYPDARHVALLARQQLEQGDDQLIMAEQVLPVYLRENIAHNKEQIKRRVK